MSITGASVALTIFQKLDLFIELLQKFSDSKKQLRCILKMLNRFSKSISEKHIFLDEDARKDIEYFLDRIKEISRRLHRAKNADHYKRASQELPHIKLDLSKAIKATSTHLFEERAKSILKNIEDRNTVAHMNGGGCNTL